MIDIPEHIQWIVKNQADQLIEQAAKEGFLLGENEIIRVFLEADPSKNKILTDWIARTYLNQGFRWEDVSAGKESKVYETLNHFKNFFKKMDKNNRNLKDYPCLSDVWLAIEPFIPTQALVGSNQAKRKQRDQALKESNVIFRDKRMIVAIPLTEQASCWWGRGTRWCTASTTTQNYFNSYNEIAPLIVVTLFANKERKESEVKKIQVWISTKNKEIFIMDEADKPVSCLFIGENWECLQPVLEWANIINPETVWFLPDHLRKREWILDSLKYNGYALSKLEEKSIDNEMSKIAVKSFPEILSYVPLAYITRELCMTAAIGSIYSIQYIPENILDYSFCFELLSINASAVTVIPEEFIDKKMLITALKNTSNIKDIYDIVKKGEQKFHQTDQQEIVKIAIGQNALFLKYLFPYYNIEPEMLKNAVLSKPSIITSVPQNLITVELCRIAIKSNPLVFREIPDKFKMNEELIRLAIKLDGSNFLNTYSFMQTKELARMAVKTCGFIIPSIPKEWIDEDMYKQAIQASPQALGYVPIELISQLAPIAIKNDPRVVRSLPDKYKTLEICKIAYAIDPITAHYFPTQILLENPEFKKVSDTSSPYKDQVTSLTNALDGWKESCVELNQNLKP